MKRKMAQALIDIHNILPQCSEDGLDDLPEDISFEEHWEQSYSNLLVVLWDIVHRFPPGLLEKSLKSGAHERLCPHDDMHDRIRRTLGYVRDSEDGNKSVCALCWLESKSDKKMVERFHSPHGSVVCILFSLLTIKGD